LSESVVAPYQNDRLCLVQEALVQENHRLFVLWACLQVLGGEGLILLIRDRATEAQVEEMLEELGFTSKWQ